VHIFEITDRKKFDDFLTSQSASGLQSWAWGEFQKRLGRKVWRLFITSDVGHPRASATVVKLPLPKGKSYLYCPNGPVVADNFDQEKIWRLFLDKVSDIVAMERPIFLRIDPKIEKLPQGLSLGLFGFRKLPWEIQPKDSLILDLTKKEEQILALMKPKTRYNIRLAEKKKVRIEQATSIAKFKDFWRLLQETFSRDKFGAHPYNYYLSLLTNLGREGLVEQFTAYYQNRPLATALVIYFAGTATYLHGASSDRFRSVMAPYAIQWAAIRAAKIRKMKYYDFGGIAPEGAKRNHAWRGITRFKKGFGGQEVSYVGAYDLPYNKLWYTLYRMARKVNRMF